MGCWWRRHTSWWTGVFSEQCSLLSPWKPCRNYPNHQQLDITAVYLFHYILLLFLLLCLNLNNLLLFSELAEKKISLSCEWCKLKVRQLSPVHNNSWDCGRVNVTSTQLCLLSCVAICNSRPLMLFFLPFLHSRSLSSFSYCSFCFRNSLT